MSTLATFSFASAGLAVGLSFWPVRLFAPFHYSA